MEHSRCDAAETHLDCVRISSRADDRLQFPRLDPRYGNGDCATIGRSIAGCAITGCCTTSGAAITDVRT